MEPSVLTRSRHANGAIYNRHLSLSSDIEPNIHETRQEFANIGAPSPRQISKVCSPTSRSSIPGSFRWHSAPVSNHPSHHRLSQSKNNTCHLLKVTQSGHTDPLHTIQTPNRRTDRTVRTQRNWWENSQRPRVTSPVYRDTCETEYGC